MIQRPTVGLVGGIKGFLKQPPKMRSAYMAGGLQFLAPRWTLVQLLSWLLPHVGRAAINKALIQSVEDPHVTRVVKKAGEIPGMLSVREMILCHALVLLMQPDIVVETGVANGSSSVAILSAMRKLGKGTLHSIDLPMVEIDGKITAFGEKYEGSLCETTVVPGFDKVGWLVSDELRAQWQLYLGDSLKVLPGVLGAAKKVNLFLHDSLHSYEHMTKEFELAWPYINEGGIIVADDVFAFRHSAVADFAQSVRTQFRTYFGMGMMRKSLSASEGR